MIEESESILQHVILLILSLPQVPNFGSPKSRERVARNFIKSYGRTRFRELLSALARGESGQTIADGFGVSRERVRQWKNAFGTVITLYQLHPEVERILKERRSA